jgi:signal transduction histidine kinase
VNIGESPPPVVGVVADESALPEVHERIVLAVEATGATTESWNETSALSQAGTVDIVVFDLGSTPERLLPIIASLDSEPRTSAIPRIFVVDEALAASRLAELGSGAIVVSGAPLSTLTGAVSSAIIQVEARKEREHVARSSSGALREAEQALAKVQTGGVSLAHDVRVLFGVILGFAANLRDGFVGPITDEQHQHLVSIVEATGDASGLVERYADLLRRATPAPLDSTPAPRQATRRQVDVSALVRGTTLLFQGIAGLKRITVGTDAERAVHAWCDPLQIKQALVNLVSNAIKFTPAGGTVTAIARMGPPASARGGATARRDLEIVVSDTGPGIPEDDRARVFERGARLERDRDLPGSGQGLAIVRDIAEMHGGTVRAEENAEGGASIVVVIPTDRRARSREMPAVTLPSAPPHSHNSPHGA